MKLELSVSLPKPGRFPKTRSHGFCAHSYRNTGAVGVAPRKP